MALDTVRDFIGQKKIVYIDFPMRIVTNSDYKKAVEIILDELNTCEIGSFLTIGDPMIYSTFIYILEELKDKNIDIEIVSGIPSFVSAAGISKTPIAMKGERFLLCDEVDIDLLDKIDSVVCLKTSKEKDKILNELETIGFDYKYVKRATLKEEEILTNREDIIKDTDYMSLIIGRKSKN